MHWAVCSLMYNGLKHWVGSFPVDSGATLVSLYLEMSDLSVMSDCVWACMRACATHGHMMCDGTIFAGFGHSIHHFGNIPMVCQNV